MGRRRQGEFPKITIHKARNAARLRFGNKDIRLGPAGSREAQLNYELTPPQFLYQCL